MKSHDSSDSFKPFAHLKALLEKHAVSPLPEPGRGQAAGKPCLPGKHSYGRFMHRTPGAVTQPDEPVSDDRLFRAAMAGVTPLDRMDARAPGNAGRSRRVPPVGTGDPESDALLRLGRLVNRGEGFIVAQTPEYMEGTGWGVHPLLTERLHRGDFAIQAHVDLHGCSAAEARIVFDNFLKASIAEGKRAVLVVHGRGLSSPTQPVLKSNVYKWLTKGHWRKWVLAFTSARLVDGGTGATYVLLRKRPLKKAQIRRFNR